MKKKLAALLLAAVMLFSLTGCLGNAYTTVMKVDGTEISSGMYLMMQMLAYAEAEGIYETQYAEDNDGATPPEGYNILRQKIEGQSATAWIRARAEENCRRFVAVQRLAREYGVTMSDESRATVENTLMYWDYLGWEEVYYNQNGVSKDTFQLQLEVEALQSDLFLALWGEGGEFAPSDADLKAGYEDIRVHLEYLSIPLTYSTVAEGYDSHDEEETRRLATAAAEEMLALLESGTTLEELAEAEFREVYDFTGREYDEETSYVYTMYYNPETNYYTEEFTQELLEASVGDVGLYEGELNIMLYSVIPMFRDNDEFEEQREAILSTLYYEEFEAWLAETYNSYPVSKTFGATWYYRPSKIK